MSEATTNIEQRLEKIHDIYMNLDMLFDELSYSIPDNIRDLLKDKILGDKKLKELMQGIEHHRPPRFFLIGRTGVGKSSLINALCNSYVADVSDVESCTKSARIFDCKEEGRTLLSIMDSRGTAESDSLDYNITAEEQLLKDVTDFSPDIVLLILSCITRDNIKQDIELLKKIRKRYYSENLVELPIIVVLNKADCVPPSKATNPKEYPINKEKTISLICEHFKKLFSENHLKIDNLIAVSSYIDWKIGDREVNAEEINELCKDDVSHLEISFDGRYQIEDLRTILENSITDYDAKMGMKMTFKMNEVIKNIAKQLVAIFSTISGVIAATPIPLSDIYILITLESILVALIMALSGCELSIQAAKDFLFSLVKTSGLGLSLRVSVQQLSKLFNLAGVGVGSAISAFVASSGTYVIGNAAINHYIDGKSLKEVKKLFKKDTQKANQ